MEKSPHTLLMITSAVFGLGLVPAIGACVMTPFLFDAPGADKNWKVWFLFCSIVSTPVVIIISLIGAWLCYHWLYYRAATVLSLLPVLSVLLIIAAFATIGNESFGKP